MKKPWTCLSVALVSMMLVLLSTGFAQERPGELQKAAEVKKIDTFLGEVEGVDSSAKTMTVKVKFEMEFYVHEKNVLTKEYLAEEGDIMFDISSARLVGFREMKDIQKGDFVRVGYEKKGETFVAHTVLKVPKRK